MHDNFYGMKDSQRESTRISNKTRKKKGRKKFYNSAEEWANKLNWRVDIMSKHILARETNGRGVV